MRQSFVEESLIQYDWEKMSKSLQTFIFILVHDINGFWILEYSRTLAIWAISMKTKVTNVEKTRTLPIWLSKKIHEDLGM